MSQIAIKRKEKGITQIELANLIGVTQANISAWENGIAFPTSDKLPKLAKIFGCTIDELYRKE